MSTLQQLLAKTQVAVTELPAVTASDNGKILKVSGGAWTAGAETVELPADWEYIPAEGRYGDYTIYMNEGYTQPYFYPGDNVDYTLYLTTAKG